MKRRIIELIKITFAAILISVLINIFVISTVVTGASMEPGIHDGDYVLVNHQIYKFQEPSRGQIIVFKTHLKDDKGNDKTLVKRVIGVGGDQIEVKNGSVYINGEELREDYTKDGITNGEVAKVTVPENAVFCLGDNRLNSTDSRNFEVWFVYKEDIIGQVFFRLYPFNRIGIIGS